MQFGVERDGAPVRWGPMAAACPVARAGDRAWAEKEENEEKKKTEEDEDEEGEEEEGEEEDPGSSWRPTSGQVTQNPQGLQVSSGLRGSAQPCSTRSLLDNGTPPHRKSCSAGTLIPCTTWDSFTHRCSGCTVKGTKRFNGKHLYLFMKPSAGVGWC